MADTRSHSKGVASLRLFGVTIDVRLSWALAALLIATSLASGAFPMLYKGLPPSAYWLMAIIVVVGLALSIVLHEMAHTLVGRAFGMSVNRISLFLFGGRAELEQEPTSAQAELAMALAGPTLSLVLALIFAVLGRQLQASGLRVLGAAFDYLASLNVVLAVFNMVPAFPMDGGRVLRALVWLGTRDLNRATRIATRLGEAFGVLLIALGAGAAFLGQLVGGLWWILIGFFIHSSARSYRALGEERHALQGLSVADVMSTRLDTVPADTTLDVFISRRLYATRHGLYPVVDGNAWVGVVAPEDILQVPRERWADTRVGDICAPARDVATVSATDDAGLLLERMQGAHDGRVLVVDQGSLVGIVTLVDLRERLRLNQLFAPA